MKFSQEHSRHANLSVYGLKSLRRKNWLVSDIRKALQDDDLDAVVASIEQGEPIINKEALGAELALPHGTVMPVDECASNLRAAFTEYVLIATENPNQ